MYKFLQLFIFLVISIVIVTGCSNEVDSDDPTEQEDTTPVEEEPQEANEIDEEEDIEDESSVEDTSEDLEEEEKEEQETETLGQQMNLGDFNVYLGGEMIETSDSIIIHGESNMLPNARIFAEVSVGDDEYFADATELVQEDGSFYLELPHHDLKKETLVTIKFDFDGQQEEPIRRHYGDRGQNLVGPYIYKQQGKVGSGSPQNIFNTAIVKTTFFPSDELAIRQFQEPNWYPIPDDMGDPHVWIEVEEITNDAEFFYLHGRSNLIEGSKLSGRYAGSNDDTSVLPDGSFNMKFDYKYDESATFVIEFDPSHWSQWNVVKETYGESGQNLVGGLVETNRWNNNLTIVKEAQLESNEINVPDNVELTIDGADVMMLLPDHLLFDFNEYELKDESKELLNEISKTLESFDKDIEIEISGHTDNIGEEQYNLELSEKRAEVVKDYLIEQTDLSSAKITTVGYGKTKPIASNDTEAGQAKNRRVEIIINLR